MGLRFRKSISIIPGVKLNFGKTGMSLSAGVPGFRKTFHTSGRVTTTIGIPGTGIYYVDTKNTKSKESGSSRESVNSSHTEYDRDVNNDSCNQEHDVLNDYGTKNIVYASNESEQNYQDTKTFISQIDVNTLKSIHKTSDDSIDWTEVLVSETAPDESYNQKMWEYYHNLSPKILSGDIDTYLQLIYDVNPLDDLLNYGSNFEFGTDRSTMIEVEFVINELALKSASEQMCNAEYNNLLREYISSVCIRIARDMFALLPISNTIIHAVLNQKTVISVNFDRTNLSKIKLGFIDPFDIVEKFNYNMNFNSNYGFLSVDRIVI